MSSPSLPASGPSTGMQSLGSEACGLACMVVGMSHMCVQAILLPCEEEDIHMEQTPGAGGV